MIGVIYENYFSRGNSDVYPTHDENNGVTVFAIIIQNRTTI